jgi:hypothetical protein
MKSTKKRRRGLILAPDDLEVGSHYMVYGLVGDPDAPLSASGQPFQVKAINLPFVLGRWVADPLGPPVTVDVRLVLLMRASDDYVRAATPPARE